MKEKPAKREAWPRIKPVINHGKPMFMVDCRINGRGERKFFVTTREAEGEQQRQQVKRANEGNSAFDFPQDIRIDAIAAMKILERHDATLRECAKFYDSHHGIAKGDKTIQQIIDELLPAKTAAGSRRSISKIFGFAECLCSDLRFRKGNQRQSTGR